MVKGTSVAFEKPTTFNKIEQLFGYVQEEKVSAFKSPLITARLFNFIAHIIVQHYKVIYNPYI
jgi:hypothetical protein